MSEITKLYENAGVKKEVIKGCYDYYSKLGIDIWKENDCRGKNCDTCKKDKSIKRYPPFTAEKQIELIKWLAGFYVHINNKGEVINISTGDGYISYYAGNLADAIALYINSKWDNLTPEEKQQVKGILE